MARRKRKNPSINKLWRRFGKDTDSVGATSKKIKAAGYKAQYQSLGHRSNRRYVNRKENPGNISLLSIAKWGAIAIAGYFVFTKFIAPNIPGLSGIVNNSQMSWDYLNSNAIVAATENNPNGAGIRNQPIRMGRGVM